MKTITTLLNNASTVTVTTPVKRTTVRSSLRELKGLVANTISTTVGLVNESLVIANDIVSIIPTVVTTTKEVASLTNIYVREAALNVNLSEEQVELYKSLTSEQRVAFRAAMSAKLGADTISFLKDLFKEEEEEVTTTK